MGTRMCGNVGAVDKETTSLHALNVQAAVFPICMTWTKFPGADHFYPNKSDISYLKTSRAFDVLIHSGKPNSVG